MIKSHPFWFKENRGLTAVLNDLIEEGKKLNPLYIARMDADDISKSDRFVKTNQLFGETPGCGCIGWGD